MSLLRYSFIIDDFYGIKLSREKLSLIDAHFISASHHYYRASGSDDLSFSRFHQELFWRHLVRLMDIVASGNFVRAIDSTRRGLHLPMGWSTDFLRFSGSIKISSGLFPDPHMFLEMCPDRRYPAGLDFPYDTLLDRPTLRPAEIQLETGIA